MIPPLVAKIAFIVYALVLFAAQALLLSAPGGRIPIYAVLGVIASIPVLCDNRKLRLWAVPAILLAMALIIYDHQAGVRFQQRTGAIRQMRATPSKASTRAEVDRERGDLTSVSSWARRSKRSIT
jgi:hypothetical protein